MTIEWNPTGKLPVGCDLLLVPVFEQSWNTCHVLARLKRQIGPLVERAVVSRNFDGGRNTAFEVTPEDVDLPQRIVFVGMGHREEFSARTAIEAGAKLVRIGTDRERTRLAIAIPTAIPDSVQGIVTGIGLGAYRADRYRTTRNTRNSVDSITLFGPDGMPDTESAIRRGEVLFRAVNGARDLVNEPANMLTPSKFAEIARNQADRLGLEWEILEPDHLQKAGAGLILGVGAAGEDGPRVVRISYHPPDGDGESVAIVGKGITFDTGGLHLKTKGIIESMKGDMAGAAAVLGAMEAVATLGAKRRIDAWLAISDNLVGPKAMKPGDILTSASGLTVEINNTDAEGRLVLADVMTLAKRRSPNRIIDVATLTGSCVVALGEQTAGLFSKDERLATEITQAATRAGEPMWRLPMDRQLDHQIRSDIADLKNLGDRWGGAIQAALFLSEFAGDLPHAHIDIAGPAWSDHETPIGPRGGTGFGLLTLVEFLTAVSA